MLKIWLPLLIASLTFSACSNQQEKSEQAYIDQSAVVADELKANLGSQLRLAMKAGGPVKAMQVCQHMAQPLTTQTSDAHEGARVSRTALRVRNPANSPDAQSTSILEYWEAMLAGGESPPAAYLIRNEETITVHHPILIQQVCLQCHGDPAGFSKELQAELDELYPDDQATGYEIGQLRGAFRIEFSIQ